MVCFLGGQHKCKAFIMQSKTQPRNWFFSFINSAPRCGSQHLVCNKSWRLSKGQSINAYDYVQCPLRLWIWKIKLSSWTKMADTLDILNWLRDGVIPMLATSACQELLWETDYTHLVWLSENLKALLCRKDEDDNRKPENDKLWCYQVSKIWKV